MLLSPRSIPAAMMCPMDPAASTSTKVMPSGSPESMSLPESSRLSPFSSLAFFEVLGAHPFLTAKSMMKVQSLLELGVLRGAWRPSVPHGEEHDEGSGAHVDVLPGPNEPSAVQVLGKPVASDHLVRGDPGARGQAPCRHADARPRRHGALAAEANPARCVH